MDGFPRWVCYRWVDGSGVVAHRSTELSWGDVPDEGFLCIRVWRSELFSDVYYGRDYFVRSKDGWFEMRDRKPSRKLPRSSWKTGTLLPDETWELVRQRLHAEVMP